LILGTVWGSFLNVVAYRLLSGDSFFKIRSFCPHCHRTLEWYELVPLISWIFLQGKCRTCGASISKLYPFIEFLSAASFSLLILQTPTDWWIGYSIFFSLLLISVRTDLQAMLISRWVTLCALPIPFVLSFTTFLPLTPIQSLIGCISAGFFLKMIQLSFKWYKGKEGLGQGDIDLLMLIGAFTGFLGWWSTLFFGSVAGTLYACLLLLQKQSLLQRIPFGPFLAFGAALYVVYPRFAFLLFALT
jgi:prepilin signal peptidase PulO-like enzyme (type II secretory pathway)